MPSDVKYNYEFVSEFAKSNGFEILTKKEDYIKAIQRIEILCSCKRESFTISFTHFKCEIKTIHCKMCSRENKKKANSLSFEFVYNYVKNTGCTLLSEQYVGQRQKLKILCSCGVNIFERPFADFKNGNQIVCLECAEKNRIETTHNTKLKEYSKIIEESGCELLSDYDGYYTLCDFKCPCGNTFTTRMTNFIHENKRNCDVCTKNRIHSNRKGTEEESIRRSIPYKEWKRKVFEKDNYTCQICGDSTGGNLRAHHIYNFKQFPEKRFEVENGMTLCDGCHNPSKYGSFHWFYGAKNNTPEQLYEYIEKYKRGAFEVSKLANLF